MKEPKSVSWFRQKLEKTLEVACSLGTEPHIIKIDSVALIGTDGKTLPYAFCPIHDAYFGISADDRMDGMVLKLREEPVEVECSDETKNSST